MAIESNEVWKDRRIIALSKEITHLRKTLLIAGDGEATTKLQRRLLIAVEERAKIAYSQFKA